MRAEYIYTTPEGSPPIAADVYYSTRPTGAWDRPKPVGGFVVGNKSLVSNAVIDYLMEELQMVVVVPDYRLCPAVSVWEGPVADAKACVAWVHDKLPGLLERMENKVAIDVNRIATIGFSAGGTLALLLAAEKHKPTACLVFYGELYWSDPFWSQPKAALAGLPVISKDLYNRVYDEGIVASAPSTRGPNGPDLTNPRNAWLLTSIKEGWWLKEVVKDGNLARLDPVSLFGPGFPPTAFVHGTADVVSPFRFSEAAHDSLQAHGIETALFSVPDKGHDFETSLTTNDADFVKVLEGLQWLSRKV